MPLSPGPNKEHLLAFGAPHSGTYDSYLRYWNAEPQVPLLSRMLYADHKTYLVELLMKQDQMSMACSLEGRVPFLDHPSGPRFACKRCRTACMNLCSGGTGKYILKRAVEDLLPREVIYRKKMGFPTPLRRWTAAASPRRCTDRRAPGSRWPAGSQLISISLISMTCSLVTGAASKRDRPHLASAERKFGRHFYHEQSKRIRLLIEEDPRPPGPHGSGRNPHPRAKQALSKRWGRPPAFR